jgi:hypothetical protein
MHTDQNGGAHLRARADLAQITEDLAATPLPWMEETLRHCVPIVEEMVGLGLVERAEATDAIWGGCKASGFVDERGTDAVQQLLVEATKQHREKAPTNGVSGAGTPAPSKSGRQGSALDEDPPHWQVEHWPEAVRTDQLLDEICEVLRRYMVLPKHAAEAMALWVLHAWSIGAWEISPLLIVVSPTKQCGKSTLLAILFWILPRSELFANATASPVFRLIEDAKPAVPAFLFDEGDSYFKPDKEDLRGIINSGWMKVTARVVRTEGDGNKRRARRFSTWAPKVIATIKAVADTLMDRGVIIKMRRATKAEKKRVERFMMRDTDQFADLRNKCCRWATDQAALADADPSIPDALANRPADNWRSLLAIADTADGDWPKHARDAALALSGLAGKEDRSIDLLADIRRVFEDCELEWLGAETLVERLVALDETPWAEWRPGDKPLTSRGLAKMLGEFEIESDNKHRPRRYWRRDFEEAWASYL